MSITNNLVRDAIRDLQHATGAIRRLNVLARMGAIPDHDHYRQLHQAATSLNRAMNELIRCLKAQDAYQQESPETTP